jgi:hypothetical protein
MGEMKPQVCKDPRPASTSSNSTNPPARASAGPTPWPDRPHPADDPALARAGDRRREIPKHGPSVPVAIKGSEYARQWKKLHFPKTTVQFGGALTFAVEESPTRERQMEVAGQVFARVREPYEGLEPKRI